MNEEKFNKLWEDAVTNADLRTERPCPTAGMSDELAEAIIKAGEENRSLTIVRNEKQQKQ